MPPVGDYTDAVMKAWKSKVWSWEKKGPSAGFGESEYTKAISATLKMKDWVARQSAIMDKYDPDKKIGLYVDEWGIWTDPNPGSNPGFLQQQNTLRDAVIAALNLDIFIRNADRVRGANIAQMINVLQAMILTQWAQDGADADLPRLSHVRAVPGCDACAGKFRSRHVQLRRRYPAAGGCSGCRWFGPHVDGTRERRSEPPARILASAE